MREWGLELLSRLLPLVRARMEAEESLTPDLDQLHVFVDKWCGPELCRRLNQWIAGQNIWSSGSCPGQACLSTEAATCVRRQTRCIPEPR